MKICIIELDQMSRVGSRGRHAGCRPKNLMLYVHCTCAVLCILFHKFAWQFSSNQCHFCIRILGFHNNTRKIHNKIQFLNKGPTKDRRLDDEQDHLYHLLFLIILISYIPSIKQNILLTISDNNGYLWTYLPGPLKLSILPNTYST